MLSKVICSGPLLVLFAAVFSSTHIDFASDQAVFTTPVSEQIIESWKALSPVTAFHIAMERLLMA